MCCGSDQGSSDLSAPTLRPTGTRRRQLEWFTNFVLVVVSLFGCSVGAGLMGFYKLHLLSFISYEFVLVPFVLLGGGALTLLVSVVGLLATSRRSPCLLTFYAFCLGIAFLVLCAGVVASVRIIFTIHVGIDHQLAIPLIKQYGEGIYVTHTWDVLQKHYRCCGAETTFDLGYMAWTQNPGLAQHNAVPDSCCLEPEEGCGRGIFEGHNLDKMEIYVKKIHVHGCIRAMEDVLKGHVVPMMTIFAISGSILAMVELLGIVLACCLAAVLRDENQERARMAREHTMQRISIKAEQEDFDNI